MHLCNFPCLYNTNLQSKNHLKEEKKTTANLKLNAYIISFITKVNIVTI